MSRLFEVSGMEKVLELLAVRYFEGFGAGPFSGNLSLKNYSDSFV
jgi:hypothetical protein